MPLCDREAFDYLMDNSIFFYGERDRRGKQINGDRFPENMLETSQSVATEQLKTAS